MKSIPEIIATELAVSTSQTKAAIALLDEGATVPFIARYRKEATDSLNDIQLRFLEERLRYLRELEERRTVILNNIREQEKLTTELEIAIIAAETKTGLEDLYLPYKPRRRTKAQAAREAGLQPLAETLLHDPTFDPQSIALQYVNAEHNIMDAKIALDGARHILMEMLAENPELTGKLREQLWQQAVIVSKLVANKKQSGIKFADYFDFSQPIHSIPSHRVLALLRGRKEGVLTLTLNTGATEDANHVYQGMVAQHFNIAQLNRAADAWLLETVRVTWTAKLFPRLELELMHRLRDAAEEEAIRIFGQNAKDLLLAAPAGRLPIIGLDPGIRTGVKIAVINSTGNVIITGTVYPHPPKNQWNQSIETLKLLAQQHGAKLISIGNGTASRETDKLVRDLIVRYPELGLKAVVVNEAGASVYSASELAAKEFPDMDVSLRGAVSIARRLQDPLAELVKIEPKAIGVGQYQHDVNQTKLALTLDHVVEDCVNLVGVDLNTASASLLSRVSGLNRALADNIVNYRNEHGAFRNREELKQVSRLGDKTFQQAAGFLRITDGTNPLDASSVHPEAYPVVERIIYESKRSVKNLIGDSKFLRTLDPKRFIDANFGIPTVQDILTELEKPGRDPRPEFKTANFLEGVQNIQDLRPDMILEGVITNVTNFGAFVDIGVHQDGLIHISALAEKFVSDPRKLVKPGDLVKVKVVEIDLERQRIALTMRFAEPVHKPTVTSTDSDKPMVENPAKSKRASKKSKPSSTPALPLSSGAMAEAWAQALKAKNK
jgi:uncharacterized protein